MKPRVKVTVEGTLRDHDGPPVRNALVYFRMVRSSQSHQSEDWTSTTTDDSGRYRVEVPAGRYAVQFHANPPDVHERVYLPAVDLRRPHEVFDYVYEGVRLTCRVLAPDSSLLPGTRITLSTARDVTGFRTESGQFTMMLQPGMCDVLVEPWSLVAGLPSIRFDGIEVRSDTLVDFQLTGERVSGRVDGPDGSPLRGAMIWAAGRAASASAYTNDAGLYEFLIPAGTYEFGFYPGSADRRLASRKLGYWMIDAPRVLDWPITGVWWSGMVRDRATGDLLPGAEVLAREIHYAGAASDVCDSGGRYRILVVPGSAYDLSATFEPLGLGGSIDWIPAGADTTIDLYLDPGVYAEFAGRATQGTPRPRRGEPSRSP